MANLTKKWSPEEEKALRELKEEQNSKSRINWKIISEVLNQKLQTNKTSKQCREHFFNYLQFGEGVEASFKWTQDELDLFHALYLDHGSSWSLISRSYKNKSENGVKNMFNNTVRKSAKILHEYEKKILKKYKKGITGELLIILLDLSNEIKKKLTSEGLTVNQDSSIFMYRSRVLRFCFSAEKYSNENLEELIQLVKDISTKFKCFSVFKVKHRNQFKITTKCLKSIYEFDKISKQNIKELFSLSENGCYPSSVDTGSQLQQNDKIVDEYLDVENLELPKIESIYQHQNKMFQFDAMEAFGATLQLNLFYF